MRHHIGPHSGVPHTAQDKCIWVRDRHPQRKLTYAEYVPLIMLGIVLAGLFVHDFIPQIIH